MFDQEKIFKFIFGVGIMLFVITNIGLFLVGVKIALLFFGEVNIMGIQMTQ
jgi:hypothetical protein